MKAKEPVMTRLLAACCSACPLCMCARQWPDSGFAKAMRKIEKNCPACKAYARLKHTGAHGGPASHGVAW